MNRLLLVCLIALTGCLVSCTDKDKIPTGVLARDKMKLVLWDMLQAERFRETFVRDSSKDLKTETFKLYAQVFAIHKVSKDEFIKSYKFYMSRPDIAREMFDSLASQANRRREDMYRPKYLDTSKIKKQSSDSLIHADTLKTAEPQLVKPQPPVTPSPIFPTAPKIITRNKKASLRQFKGDSLLRKKMQLKQ